MSEKQNIEWKASWRDEWLKWICGFANAHGGTLIIGKDDHGTTVGVNNHEELLKLIPDKIKSYLLLVCDVNLLPEDGRQVIEIVVEEQSMPISYEGKYYYRAGATNRELQAGQLSDFLLRKSGKSWDSVIEPTATLNDINPEAIASFRNAAAKARRLPELTSDDDLILLQRLRLADGNRLTRAALIAFGKDPKRFFPSAFVKIGRFGTSDADLQFAEVAEGNAFQMADEVIQTLDRKFLRGPITYNAIQRIEGTEYPYDALREVVLNSIVHRTYTNAPVQISLYDDRMIIWNEGQLPDDLTVEDLKMKHPSLPRNPLLAETFAKGGLIEAWGRGTIRIIEWCQEAFLPDPVFEQVAGGTQVTIIGDPYEYSRLESAGLDERQMQAIYHMKENGPITNSGYQKLLVVSKRTASNDLKELESKKLIKRIGITGKGTSYQLVYGKPPIKPAKTPSLKKRLAELDKSLAGIKPDEEVQEHFNQEVFFRIFDSWLSKLLAAIIAVSKQFNKYFNNPHHAVYVENAGGVIEFANEAPDKVVTSLREQCEKNSGALRNNKSKLNLSLNYGTFKKGGLKTFGCNYTLEVEFEMIKYKVIMDAFSNDERRNRLERFERLLHKPVTSKEIKNLADEMAESIIKHMEFHSKGLTKRATKGQ